MNVSPCRCTPMIQCRRCRDIEHQVRRDPAVALGFALDALREQASPPRGGRRTLDGMEWDAQREGAVLLTWAGPVHVYRLRIVDQRARIERLYAGRPPWRRMSYAQDVVDQMAALIPAPTHPYGIVAAPGKLFSSSPCRDLAQAVKLARMAQRRGIAVAVVRGGW